MKLAILLVTSLLTVTTMAQVGIGTTTPATTLDVNGAITTRETVVNITGNTVSIPANTSLVQVAGVATANVLMTVPAAPNPGQRLVVFNNSIGGFGLTLNASTIPFGQIGEFIYSSGAWRSIVPAPSIIPYASSLPVTLTTLLSGLENTGALVGFGNSLSGVTLSSGAIDITGGAGVSLNFGFTVPRDGTIKSISAFFSSTVALSLIGTNVAIKAQLYKSNSLSSNTFTAVPMASVILSPSLSGTLSIGTTRTGILSGLSIPVTSQSRYLLAFSTTATGLSLLTVVEGYASAGISIE